MPSASERKSMLILGACGLFEQHGCLLVAFALNIRTIHIKYKTQVRIPKSSIKCALIFMILYYTKIRIQQ